MSDKRINWYHGKKVYSDDLTDDQDYYVQRLTEGPKDFAGSGVINSYFNSALAVTAFRGDYISEHQTDDYTVSDTSLNTQKMLYKQVFKASTNNIQQIELMLSSDGAATGEIEIEVRPLQDGTDKNSPALSYIGRTTLDTASLAVTTPTREIFDFNPSPNYGTTNPDLTSIGSLTVGNYYAIYIFRDMPNPGVVTLYRSAASSNEDYPDGYAALSDDDGVTFAANSPFSLYFAILNNAVTVKAGTAYINGVRVDLPNDVHNVSLATNEDVSGQNNIIAITYALTEANYEAHPRTGNPVATRLEDNYSIVAFKENDPRYLDPDYLQLAQIEIDTLIDGVIVSNTSITDRRKVLPKVYSNFDQEYITEFAKVATNGSYLEVTTHRMIRSDSTTEIIYDGDAGRVFNLTTNAVVDISGVPVGYPTITLGTVASTDFASGDIVQISYNIDDSEIDYNTYLVMPSPNGRLFRFNISTEPAGTTVTLTGQEFTHKNLII